MTGASWAGPAVWVVCRAGQVVCRAGRRVACPAGRGEDRGAVIEILASGPLTTVQDLGRPGYAHLGVGESGAADAPSLRLANRLVGNAESAAGLELTFGGLAARFSPAPRSRSPARRAPARSAAGRSSSPGRSR